jgi:hypothetical protein
MLRRSTTLLAAGLVLATLLACKTKKGVASSIQSKLPYNPAGAGAVTAERTRCQANAYGSDLNIKCSSVFLKGMESEANEQIDTLLTVECDNIVKAGFLGIKVDWGTGGYRENSAILLKGEDGKPNCSLKTD